jgi:hypothetical protein
LNELLVNALSFTDRNTPHVAAAPYPPLPHPISDCVQVKRKRRALQRAKAGQHSDSDADDDDTSSDEDTTDEELDAKVHKAVAAGGATSLKTKTS